MNCRRFLLVTLMLCFGTFAVAQEVTGTIVGTVKDKTGAVVPHATVIVTNTDTKQAVRTLTANDKGEYTATLLPLGHYSVTAEATNFKKVTISNITLHQNDKLTFDPTLEVGSADQTVEVAAEALQVETQSATASGTINGTQIRELALNGRNYEQLLTLVPGVSDAGNADQIYVGALAPQGTSTTAFSINGGRREQSNYMVDGADNVDRGSGLTLLAFPSADAIAEFKVYRGQYDPELGRAGSGQVDVITRSGTSKLHGNAYEFARNDFMNSNTFFNKRAQLLAGTTNRPPILRYHDFGGTIGGPVYIPKIYEQTDKTFFFFSEEQRRNIVYTPKHGEVPTAAMLGGTFRVPVCVAFDVNNKCTGTSTTISPASFDPLSKAYLTDVLSHFPATNAGNTSADPFGVDSTLRGIFNFREEIYKIDHRFNSRFSVAGKILYDTIPTREPGALFTNIAVDNIGATTTNSPGHNYTLRGTIAWSPTLVIEPGYGYSYGGIISTPEAATNLLLKTSATNVVSALGNTLPFATTLGRVPNVTFSGGTGAQSFGPYNDYNINHSFFTNVTKTWGTHTMKFGAVFYHYRKNENNATGNEGTFAYNSNGTPATAANLGGASTVLCTGTAGAAGSNCPFAYEQAWANFLLGRPGTFSQSLVDLTADIRDNQFEYYAQDAWRWRSNVTVSYGFRHSFYRQPTDALGLMGQFDPAFYDPAKAPCILANGTNDVTKLSNGTFKSACNPNYDPLNGYIYTNPPAGFANHQSPYGNKIGKEYNWAIAPRLGIAWDPWSDGKTSVRAGYGMFYDAATIFGNAENDIFQGSGFQNAFAVSSTTSGAVPITVTNGNPTGGTAVPANGISQNIARGRSLLDPNYHPSYTSQWSLDIQHDLGGGFLADVGYYGNSGFHLPGFLDINQPAVDSYVACTAATPCKGGPLGANVINFDTTGTPAVPILVNGVQTPVVNSSTAIRLNALRPYVGYLGIDATRNIFTSNYNSLQTQLQKKFSGNTMLNVAYTWSHTLTSSIADRSSGSIMPVQNNIRNNNWGPGIGDRRHVLTTNFVWDMPWYQTQQGLLGHFLGGWEISGVATFQSGLPATAASPGTFDPTGSDCTITGGSLCSDRVYQVGDPNSGAPHNYFTGWFNNSAFVLPVATDRALPTEQPGALRLPGFWRTDMGLFKNLKFGEHVTTQLRLEAYNALNHTNPVCCSSTTFGNASFGLISSTRDPRTLQIGAKIGF